jgi:predicted membrane-bound spermidine synthase
MSSKPRREQVIPFALLAACFFGSGLTALIYELLWTRRLQLTFGSTTYSVTTVLAAFMAGLGLGSYLIGRRVDRSPLGGIRIYAYMELGVGTFALLSLPLLSLVESIYGGLQSWLQLGQGGATLLKFALAFPVLAFPAGLMGGTLPALVQGLTRTRAALPTTVGRLYGLNTAGAAVGTALAGMLMIELLGLWRSMVLAAVLNLGIGVLVLTRLSRAAPPSDRKPGQAEPSPDETNRPGTDSKVMLRDHLRSRPVLFCTVAVVFTGFLSMLYEVVWTRMLSLMMGSSTYAFTIVLSIFLVGIAVGALIYSRTARSRPPTAFGLTLVLLGLSLWVVISLVVIPSLPLLLVQMAQIPGLDFGRILIFEALFAAFILLVPTLLLGAALPMAMGIISRAMGQLGRDVGGVYLVNTAGAIAGSVLTGFLFIPAWGTQSTLLGGLMANLVLVGVGVVTFAGTLRRQALGLLVVGLMAVVSLAQPQWPPVVFDAGLGYRLDQTASTDRLGMLVHLHRSPNKLVFREEGRNATITVRHFPKGISLLVNGKPDASTSGDMLTQVVLGIVATMAHPEPKSVGIVGWGSGVTTYTTTFFPEVERIDTVEIEPAVLRASRFFNGVNGGVERHPRVKVIYDDARSYFLTADLRYDVIISEPSNPWMVGVSSLFSKDYYALAKTRLKPGGIFGQWLQLCRIDARSVALILRTLLDSFPHAQLWYSDASNVILLGSDRPIRVTRQRVEEAYRRSRLLRFHMDVYGPGDDPGHFYGCYLLDRQAIARIVQRFEPEVMTDDRPVLEYQAVRNLYAHVHQHISDLWRAKMAMKQLLPPHHGGASPAQAMVGNGRILRTLPPLGEKAMTWAAGLMPDEPQLRLARAKALYRVGKNARSRALLQGLPQGPSYQAEAALLDARLLLRARRPKAALLRLEQMGTIRPTARLVYQLRAAVSARRYDLSWDFAERLVQRLDDAWDVDVQQVYRARLYEQIGELVELTGDADRGIRLLTRRREAYDGEFHRLLSLAKAYHRAKRTREAGKILEEVLKYGIPDREILQLCTRIYDALKEEDRAKACRRTLSIVDERAPGKTLWD